MLFPLARVAGSLRPHTYFDYLNTLSVELAEAGRLEQARRGSEIALASPFAPAYPMWQETFDEITLKERRASRSMVAVSGFIREPAGSPHGRSEAKTSRRHFDTVHKLVSLTARQPAAGEEMGPDRAQGSTARVLNFQQWKRRIEHELVYRVEVSSTSLGLGS